MSHWTALHRELNLDLRPIVFGDFDRAVAMGVLEQTDLDWKRQTPANEDISSDVAAMANGRGGVICIGVGEDHATSAANSVIPTDISDGARRALAQAITAHVRPRVASLDIYGVPNPGDASGQTGVLIVEVRRSSYSPHLIQRSNDPGFRAPFRQGAKTEYMSEPELARAYASRAEASYSRRERTSQIVEDAQNRTREEGGYWTIAVSTPVDPLPLELQRPLTPQERVHLVEEATATAARMLPHSSYRTLIVSRSTPSRYNQRRGPHGWVTRFGPVVAEPGMTRGAYMMLYDDGSVALAVQSELLALHDRTEEREAATLNLGLLISASDIESLAADFFCVVDAHARLVGGVGAVSVTASVLATAGENQRVYLMERSQWDFDEAHLRVTDSIGIRKVRAITMDYQPDLGERNRRTAAVELSFEIEGQFGAEELRLFRATDPSAADPID